MSLPNNFLNNKGTIPIITILLLSSTGLGINNHLSPDSTSVELIETANAKLYEHETSEFPHIGTEKTLEFIQDYIQEDKEDHNITYDKITELSEKIDRIYFMLCEQNGYVCEIIT